jgi:hypothetical protein
MAGNEQSQEEPTTESLTRVERWIGAVIGGLLVLFAGAGTVQNWSQIPVTAFLVLGAAFLLGSAFGVLPKSVEIAKVTVHLQNRYRRALTEAAKVSDDPAVAAKLIQEAAESPGASQDSTFTDAAGHAYEAAALRKLESLLGAAVVIRNDDPRLGFDATIDSGNIKVNVEVKFFSSRYFPREILRRVAARARDSALPLLIVTNVPLPPASHEELARLRGNDSPRIEVARWNGDQDDDAELRSKINSFGVRL